MMTRLPQSHVEALAQRRAEIILYGLHLSRKVLGRETFSGLWGIRHEGLVEEKLEALRAVSDFVAYRNETYFKKGL